VSRFLSPARSIDFVSVNGTSPIRSVGLQEIERTQHDRVILPPLSDQVEHGEAVRVKQ
jgi:hypothetical protein